MGLLMLARVSARQHDFALRSAMGASGGRIASQILLEILLFVPPGIVGGLAIGAGSARLLAAMLGHVGAPIVLDVRPNPAIVLFSCGIAFLTAVVAGLWPALRMRRVAPAVDLRHGSHSVTGKMAGGWIIPIQVAISVTLLVSALLLGSTFAHLYLEPSGFQGKNLVLADVDFHAAKLPPMQTALAEKAALALLQGAPGIKSAALMSAVPLSGGVSSSREISFDKHGQKHADADIWPEAVSAEYFETMGTKIVAGRALNAADEADGKVCVLSRSAAEFLFPGEDALDRLVYSGGDDPSKDAEAIDPKNALQVVGIAEDAHFFSLRKQADHILYTPDIRAGASFGWFNLAVRTSNTSVAASSIRDALHKALPAAPAPVVYTYGELLNDHLQKERMLIILSASFAGIALVLIAVGLFGILMRSVTQRTREIGIRMALGATRSSVVVSVLHRTLWRILIGLGLGIPVALLTGHLMNSLLYGVSGYSPAALVGATLVLGFCAAVASLVPARRAASIDPLQALRTE
jgi:predicted permease